MQGSRFEWRISALALFAFLAALSCGNGTTMSGRMGELGRGLFVSACQVSQSPFSWSYENDSYEAPCPAFMLDLNLAVGSEVGVSYSDVEGNLDGRVDPGSVDLESAAQDLLQANPDLNAIFGINDDSALGALAAVEAAGLQDKVVIVGFDGTPEARDAILSGKALKADTVQFPKEIGRTTIQTIAAYFRGEPIPKIVPVHVEIIDQASLKAEQKP